jgi:hypothetical protein
METNTDTAAHFMSAGLSKINRHGKQNFFAITVIKGQANAIRDSSNSYILRKEL